MVLVRGSSRGKTEKGVVGAGMRDMVCIRIFGTSRCGEVFR